MKDMQYWVFQAWSSMKDEHWKPERKELVHDWHQYQYTREEKTLLPMQKIFERGSPIPTIA